MAQLNLSLKDINEISIPLPNKDKQIELAELFDKVADIIVKGNMELTSLDNLIQARFVRLIVDYIVVNGNIDDNRVLMDEPFRSAGSITALFKDDMDLARRIMSIVDGIKRNSEETA